MEYRLAKRSNIPPSPTLTIDAKAKQLKAAGEDVIGFGAGEPDFDTPAYIKDAAKAALDAGFTKYTPAAGTMELREAVAAKFKNENGIECEAAQVIISNGAKHSITNICQALLEPGDEVIIPAPYWVSYPEMVKMAGGVPVIVPTSEDDHFRITPQRLASVISPKTRMFILCSPSNPTGSMYRREDLEAIARVLEEHNLITISDEIYEKLIYGDAKHVSLASLSPAMAERTVTINGASKAFSMTGWRIGYAVGPLPIMKAVASMQSHAASNPVSFAQKGALAATTGSNDAVEAMRVEFEKRRDFMVKTLNAIDGISCQVPDGAFYAFPNIDGLLNKQFGDKAIDTDSDFAAALLEDQKVAVVPGSASGAEGYLRFSYATSQENIEKGLARLAEFAKKLTDKPAPAEEPEPTGA